MSWFLGLFLDFDTFSLTKRCSWFSKDASKKKASLEILKNCSEYLVLMRFNSQICKFLILSRNFSHFLLTRVYGYSTNLISKTQLRYCFWMIRKNEREMIWNWRNLFQRYFWRTLTCENGLWICLTRFDSLKWSDYLNPV